MLKAGTLLAMSPPDTSAPLGAEASGKNGTDASPQMQEGPRTSALARAATNGERVMRIRVQPDPVLSSPRRHEARCCELDWHPSSRGCKGPLPLRPPGRGAPLPPNCSC